MSDYCMQRGREGLKCNPEPEERDPLYTCDYCEQDIYYGEETFIGSIIVHSGECTRNYILQKEHGSLVNFTAERIFAALDDNTQFELLEQLGTEELEAVLCGRFIVAGEN